MNIGIIGLGSIGRTHARAIHQNGNHNVYALRSNKGSLTSLSDDVSFVKEIFSKEDFYKLPLDCILICTPTHLHGCNLQDIAHLDIPVLVEKPLFHSLKSVPILEAEFKNKIRVAFCLRFHPIVQQVKKIIENEELGKVLKANIVVGQYLPTWHPYTNYQKEYFSRSSMGGGALRTLSHEIDLAMHWFGKFTSLFGVASKISNLEIDVDDNVFMISNHTKGAVLNTTIDFLTPKVKRYGFILCEKGEIHYDMIQSFIKINAYDGKESKDLIVSENKMYFDQLKNFISFSSDDLTASFLEAIHVMKVIEATERSFRD